ncbi:DEKNAAC103008 [Brettanomyces naardenensis]|uniref:Small ribosomal subunit protein uS9m n=1 Tax=Brettanomyces naardenensis TaxID=13370 RepID=A0A448YME6_BRENA|nr:DEKNAAC103008 [Brettanomyces naardenensis]
MYLSRLGGLGLPRSVASLSRITVRFESTGGSQERQGHQQQRQQQQQQDQRQQQQQQQQPRLRFQQFSEYYRDPSVSRNVRELERTRLIPTIPTFYASNPLHEEHLSKLTDILNKYLTLPFDKKNSSNSWLTFDDYKEIGGGNKLKITQYQKLVTMLKRLDSIDPQLKSDEIEESLRGYRKAKEEVSATKNTKTLDDKGRAVALGRRKASSAKVYMVKGTGEFRVNGQALEEVFPSLEDRMRVLYPLQVVDGESDYNVFALSRGGGKTGQIDSIKLAMSRALCIHNPLLKKRLFSAGCLTRDHRVVERKKPGKRKARKMPTWVKR